MTEHSTEALAIAQARRIRKKVIVENGITFAYGVTFRIPDYNAVWEEKFEKIREFRKQAKGKIVPSRKSNPIFGETQWDTWHCELERDAILMKFWCS